MMLQDKKKRNWKKDGKRNIKNQRNKMFNIREI